MRTKVFAKSCFYDALIRLCKIYDYKDLQISQICKEAGFDRSTFYRTYKVKEDILKEKAYELINEYYLAIKKFGENDYKKSVFTFSFFRQHRDFFCLMHVTDLDKELQRLCFDLLEINENDTYDRYEKVFAVNGFLAVLMSWLENGMIESDEYMAKRILTQAKLRWVK